MCVHEDVLGGQGDWGLWRWQRLARSLELVGLLRRAFWMDISM